MCLCHKLIKIHICNDRDRNGVDFAVVMATAERPKMAFLLDEILFETYGQGPSPSKDFYHLVITQKEVKQYLKVQGF